MKSFTGALHKRAQGVLPCRKEIGSEFWNVPVMNERNQVFPESTQWFLSGRSALTAIVRDICRSREAHTVAMPSWCCDSMVIPFLREGMEVSFYPVYVKDGTFVQEVDESRDVLFLMDYFGYTGSAAVEHPCVIRDITHSFLSHSYSDARYFFGSLRKWTGVKTGGFAWGQELEPGTDAETFTTLRAKAMREKEKYITGETDRKDYLRIYEEAETYLDESAGVYASLEEDTVSARHLDIDFIRSQRRKNAAVLMEAFRPHLIFPSLSGGDCPMFVPILVPDGRRDDLRRYLIRHEIYCPVHWPVSGYHKLDERELHLYHNELSLICDQRYKEDDMLRIVAAIRQFWKEA